MKTNGRRSFLFSSKSWISVFACLSFLFVVATTSFSSMELLIEPTEHSSTSDHHEASVSVNFHDHNMMDHDMTDAGCMSFQCHAIALLSFELMKELNNDMQDQEVTIYSLVGTFSETQKRPPRHV